MKSSRMRPQICSLKVIGRQFQYLKNFIFIFKQQKEKIREMKFFCFLHFAIPDTEIETDGVYTY